MKVNDIAIVWRYQEEKPSLLLRFPAPTSQDLEDSTSRCVFRRYSSLCSAFMIMRGPKGPKSWHEARAKSSRPASAYAAGLRIVPERADILYGQWRAHVALTVSYSNSKSRRMVPARMLLLLALLLALCSRCCLLALLFALPLPLLLLTTPDGPLPSRSQAIRIA